MFKHKIGDLVVLGELEPPSHYEGLFVTGAQVEIIQYCCEGTEDEHYTVQLPYNPHKRWWVKDSEIATSPEYEEDDGPLTDDQISKIRAASSATNIPDEHFTDSLFQNRDNPKTNKVK